MTRYILITVSSKCHLDISCHSTIWFKILRKWEWVYRTLSPVRMHHSSFFVGRQYYIPYHIPGDVRSSFCICWWYCSRVIFYLLEDCITPQFSSIISHLIFVTPARLLHTPSFIPGEIVWHLIFVSPSKLLLNCNSHPRGDRIAPDLCLSRERLHRTSSLPMGRFYHT